MVWARRSRWPSPAAVRAAPWRATRGPWRSPRRGYRWPAGRNGGCGRSPRAAHAARTRVRAAFTARDMAAERRDAAALDRRDRLQLAEATLAVSAPLARVHVLDHALGSGLMGRVVMGD